METNATLTEQLWTPELRRCRARLDELEGERVQAEHEAAQAQAERERVAGAYRRGELTLAEAEAGTSAADRRAESANGRVLLAATAISGVRAEAADLVRAVEAKRDAALADDERDLHVQAAQLRAQAAAREAERLRVADKRKVVREACRAMLAHFDERVAAAVREQARYDADMIRWAAADGSEYALAQVPPHLRERVRSEIRRRQERDRQDELELWRTLPDGRVAATVSAPA